MQKYLDQIQEYLYGSTELDSEAVLAMLLEKYSQDEANQIENPEIAIAAKQIAQFIKLNKKLNVPLLRREICSLLNKIDLTTINNQSQFAILLKTFLSLYQDYIEFIAKEIFSLVSPQMYLFNYVENVIKLVRANKLQQTQRVMTGISFASNIKIGEWYLDYLNYVNCRSFTFDRLSMNLGKLIILLACYNKVEQIDVLKKILKQSSSKVISGLLVYVKQFPSSKILKIMFEQGILYKNLEYSINLHLMNFYNCSLDVKQTRDILTTLAIIAPENSKTFVINRILAAYWEEFDGSYLPLVNKISYLLKPDLQEKLIDSLISRLKDSPRIRSSALLANLETPFSNEQIDLIILKLFEIMRYENDDSKLNYYSNDLELLSKFVDRITENQAAIIIKNILDTEIISKKIEQQYELLKIFPKKLSNNNKVKLLKYYLSKFDYQMEDIMELIASISHFEVVANDEDFYNFIVKYLKNDIYWAGSSSTLRLQESFEKIIDSLPIVVFTKLLNKTFEILESFRLSGAVDKYENLERFLYECLFRYIMKQDFPANTLFEFLFNFEIASSFIQYINIKSYNQILKLLPLIFKFINSPEMLINERAFSILKVLLIIKFDDSKDILLDLHLSTFKLIISRFDEFDLGVKFRVAQLLLNSNLPVPEAYKPDIFVRIIKTYSAAGYHKGWTYYLTSYLLNNKVNLSLPDLTYFLRMLVQWFGDSFAPNDKNFTLEKLVDSFATITNVMTPNFKATFAIYLRKILETNDERKSNIINAILVWLKLNDDKDIDNTLILTLKDIVTAFDLLDTTGNQYVYVGKFSEILEDWSVISNDDYNYKLIYGFIVSQKGAHPLAIKPESLDLIKNRILTLPQDSKQTLLSVVIDLLKADDQKELLYEILQKLALTLELSKAQLADIFIIISKTKLIHWKYLVEIIKKYNLELADDDKYADVVFKKYCDDHYPDNLLSQKEAALNFFILYSANKKRETVVNELKLIYNSAPISESFSPSCKLFINLSIEYPSVFSGLIDDMFLRHLENISAEFRTFIREVLLNVQSILTLTQKKTILNIALTAENDFEPTLKLAYYIFDEKQRKQIRPLFVKAYYEKRNEDTDMSRALTKMVGYFYCETRVAKTLSKLFERRQIIEPVAQQINSFLHFTHENPNTKSLRLGF